MASLRELTSTIRAVATEEFSRSGGPGGQNVNKVNTQVTLRVPLDQLALPTGDLERVTTILANRCNAEGELVIQVSDTRSQRMNREIAVERAADLVSNALVRPKHRRPTRPSAAAREKRIQQKKRRSRTKDNRRNPEE